MEYVHLSGAEDVSRAASSMRQAAGDVIRAADNFSGSVTQLENVLENFLTELKSIMEKSHGSGS